MKVLGGIVVGVLALVGLVAIAAVVWLKFKFGAVVREREAMRDKELSILEPADWMGKTGLPEEIERELPRYLRRELGEMLLEEGSLKAADLVYLGECIENGNRVHYWHMPYGKEGAYAYVDVGPDSIECMGWGGGREPPEKLRAKAK